MIYDMLEGFKFYTQFVTKVFLKGFVKDICVVTRTCGLLVSRYSVHGNKHLSICFHPNPFLNSVSLIWGNMGIPAGPFLSNYESVTQSLIRLSKGKRKPENLLFWSRPCPMLHVALGIGNKEGRETQGRLVTCRLYPIVGKWWTDWFRTRHAKSCKDDSCYWCTLSITP